MNTNRFGASLMLLSVIALPASADDVYYDTARVLSAMPQTERINSPRQECHTEYTRDSYYQSGDRDVAGSVIGGIAGGLIGSQIGKGKGRIAGAAVGAATGAIVGDRIDNSGRRDSGYSTRPVERCVQVDNWQTVNRGYLVTYRYNGRDYTTSMANDPGDTVSVRVSIAPEYRNNVVSYVPGYERHDNGYHRGWDKRGRDREDRWDH